MDSAGSVHVISKELIKPSSPTPDHLKTVKLSVLDQLTPPVYISLIFFYEADELKGLASSTDQAQICHHLKQSLSKTLTSFYPLAGKIDPESFTVCCDDYGVEFVEARARAPLRDVVHEAKLDEFHKGCRGGMRVAPSGRRVVSGGFHERMGSYLSGENPKTAPEFGVLGGYFPARDLSDSNFSPSLLMGNAKLVTKRLVFDKEKLAALKKAAATGDVRDPTRVKSKPPLENTFGNGCFTAVAELSHQHRLPAPELHELVSKLRNAIRTIDDEYIRDTEREDRYLSDLGRVCDLISEGEADAFVFSSWCRFPMYEVDFGWGKPVWACTTALLVSNLAIL
ncbi:UNVERIFIED_CONTAM: Stemmadenine O-acetyltransferase [Sesamum calycinum]|uniref:Stemmadenine O-acetyltransferase n=1 Tax=Sesamum calycinum TaxID=2727403 RepID=A0AAW2SXG6_9LAMI